MIHYSSNTNDSELDFFDFYFIQGEAICLEPEDFDQARYISSKVSGEANQWKTYVFILGLLGWNRYVNERDADIPVKLQRCSILHLEKNNHIKAICNLEIAEYTVCLVITESLIAETVRIPQAAIDLPKYAAHLYIVLEVLEEEEQIIFRGFLSYEQLVNYRKLLNLQAKDNESYHFPLTLFDAEPNQLLYYLRLLSPDAIALPVASATLPELHFFEQPIEFKQPVEVSQVIDLKDWLVKNQFKSNWQAASKQRKQQIRATSAISSGAHAATASGHAAPSVEGKKLIALGSDGEQVILLIGLRPADEELEQEVDILVRVKAAKSNTYLPSNLRLAAIAKTGKIISQCTSKNKQKNIELESFCCELGNSFDIQLTFADFKFTESFVLEMPAALQTSRTKTKK